MCRIQWRGLQRLSSHCCIHEIFLCGFPADRRSIAPSSTCTHFRSVPASPGDVWEIPVEKYRKIRENCVSVAASAATKCFSCWMPDAGNYTAKLHCRIPKCRIIFAWQWKNAIWRQMVHSSFLFSFLSKLYVPTSWWSYAIEVFLSLLHASGTLPSFVTNPVILITTKSHLKTFLCASNLEEPIVSLLSWLFPLHRTVSFDTVKCYWRFLNFVALHFIW